jgi:hypothetical protein
MICKASVGGYLACSDSFGAGDALAFQHRHSRQLPALAVERSSGGYLGVKQQKLRPASAERRIIEEWSPTKY